MPPRNRHTDGPEPEPTSASNAWWSRLAAPGGPLRFLFPGSDVPDEFEPKLDPKRTQVFDDEVDPAWREPPSDQV